MGSDSKFENELRALINCHCRESASDTPDYILAQFLTGCLAAFDTAVHRREVWHGRRPAPAVTPVPEGAETPPPKPSPCGHKLLDCDACRWTGGFPREFIVSGRLLEPATPPTPGAPPAPPFCNCDLGTEADDWKHRKDCTRYGWDEAQDEIESTAPSAPPREGMGPGERKP